MHSNNKIEGLIRDLSKNPLDPEKNFYVAIEYEKLKQTASAVSFYLRAIEYGYEDVPNIVYSSLLKIAECFEDQKNRDLTVSNALLQAISLTPTRPEAYFYMSKFYEKTSNWQECYTFANMGLLYTYEDVLPIKTQYENRHSLLFQKAISAWWIGRKVESAKLLMELYLDKDNLSELYIKAIENNLSIMQIDPKQVLENNVTL